MGNKSRGNFKTMSTEQYEHINWGDVKCHIVQDPAYEKCCNACGGNIINDSVGNDEFERCVDCGMEWVGV